MANGFKVTPEMMEAVQGYDFGQAQANIDAMNKRTQQLRQKQYTAPKAGLGNILAMVLSDVAANRQQKALGEAREADWQMLTEAIAAAGQPVPEMETMTDTAVSAGMPIQVTDPLAEEMGVTSTIPPNVVTAEYEYDQPTGQMLPPRDATAAHAMMRSRDPKIREAGFQALLQMDVAGAKAKKEKGLGEKDIMDMRKEAARVQGDYIKVQDAYGKVLATQNRDPKMINDFYDRARNNFLESGGDPKKFASLEKFKGNIDAVGDMALVFSIMKMLDPGSTVREGEYASAKNTTGAAGKIANAYNALLKGDILNPAQRLVFQQQAQQMLESQRRSTLKHVSGIVAQAKRNSIPLQELNLSWVNDAAQGNVEQGMVVPGWDTGLPPAVQAKIKQLRSSGKYTERQIFDVVKDLL